MTRDPLTRRRTLRTAIAASAVLVAGCSGPEQEEEPEAEEGSGDGQPREDEVNGTGTNETGANGG